LDDLSGKAVAANQGSSPVKALLQIDTERKFNIRMIPAKDFAESFLLLETGRAVAVAQDDILLAGLRATARNPADFELVGESYTIEPYAIMLRKDDPSFKALADATITSMMASGEFDRLYAKWFQSPFPPRGINMNLPMSELLKRVVAKPTDSSDPNTYR
jgi:glutamate/aspartate transport system substrate-binding protein